MSSHLRPAIVMMALFTILTGFLYPMAITGIARVAFTRQAEGSLVSRNGKVVGSRLIGQNFATDRYFHGRPSATSGPDPKDASKSVDAPYNAASSTGSNLGPTSRKLLDRIKGDVAALRGGTGAAAVPADAVTTSASGLDPHISPAFALLQVARVAQARNMPADTVKAMVEAHIADRTIGLFGEPRVNVLELNLDLDDDTAPPVHQAG